MKKKDRARLRRRIERRAEERGWTRRFRVTVRKVDAGQSETLEVPGRDEHHASRTNAMFLIEMPLRGGLIEYDVEEI